MRRNLILFILLVIAFPGKAEERFPTDPFEEYIVPKDKCKTFRHYTGSLIFVPAKAFQREDGSTIRGDVTLRYREIRTPSEIIAADIPMTYSENGKLYQLQSSGMFEIEVEEDEKPVKLAPGKKIQVRFAAPNNLDRLEAFLLDPETRSWKKTGEDVSDFSYDPNKADLAANPENFDMSGEGGEFWQYEPDTQNRAIFKAMGVTKMGLYNYDQIYHAPNSVNLLADFRLQDGSPITTTVFVVYDGLNTVIHYDTSQFRTVFALLLRDDIRMFTILPDKRVAVLPKGAFRREEIKKAEGKTFTFRLQVQPDAAHTRGALAAVTGIR